MPEPAPQRRHVFISYTRVDRSWVDRLLQMMKPLLRAGGQQLRLWDDSQIEPGAKWRAAIETALNEAKVALLLVSDAFLASEFVMNEEVPKLLAAAEAEGVRVLWVSLSPCLVEHTPIHAYQAVLPIDHYLEELERPQQQRALKTVAEAIHKALNTQPPAGQAAPQMPSAPERPLAEKLALSAGESSDPEQAGAAPAQPRQAPAERTRSGDGKPGPGSASPTVLAGPVPQTFRLETARLGRVATGWEVRRQPLQAEGAVQDLGDGVTLPLIAIPAGEFAMGSPADEPERRECEGPRHRVRLQGFLIGQTPITQAQWRVLARLVPPLGQRWQRELSLNPSRFSDQPDSEQRPVEQVSWEQAIEFCRRLSVLTGESYTLPSEAQWEYACRADSRTPFHFGETLTPELANYAGNFTYTNGPKGGNRGQTTAVGMFPGNAWGLQDMHGNVWEWCLDHWHDNYEGAPFDGSAWVDAKTTPGLPDNPLAKLQRVKNDVSKHRLLRGGSWLYNPRNCRSACRLHDLPVNANNNVGFRVVCLPQGPSLNP